MTYGRSWVWAAGAPVRGALVATIWLYRATLGGWLGGQCRFYPSCSHYGEEAIRTHGALKGLALTAWRIVRCGPFTAGGVDPVPERKGRSVLYDIVIQKPTGAPTA